MSSTLPCQNERKITDLMVKNFNTGSKGCRRSLKCKGDEKINQSN